MLVLNTADPHVPGVSAGRAYAWIALASLAVTVLVGVWLRAALLWPGVLRGIPYVHAMHAHSHLALFGWGTAGVMALVAQRAGGARRWPAIHASLLAAASAAAFVSFLLQGYGLASIAVSSVHVLLWIVFVVAAWSSVQPATEAGVWLRTALGFLSLAGLAAVLPAVAGATGASPLVTRSVVKLFLTLLVQGWLFIAAIGVLLPASVDARASRLALGLLIVGTVPSAMAHVPGVGSGVLVGAGRVGLFLTGLGSLIAGALLVRGRASTREASPIDAMRAWRLLAAVCILLKGLGEIGVSLADSRLVILLRPAVIAYLHLVLLGVLTSALVAVLAPHRRAAHTAALHAAGLLTMLGALLGLAGMELTGSMSAVVTPRMLNVIAFAGGTLSAVALLAVTVPGLLATRGVLRPHRRPGTVAVAQSG